MNYFARYQGTKNWTEMSQATPALAAKAFVEFSPYHVRDTFMVQVKKAHGKVHLLKVHVEGYLTVEHAE